ncbi:MAG TPA: hypothetical protein ENI73_03250 [Spirochaetes bacterium]|nr:hypothetical protein [Spirochaetota bacterium]
MKRLSILIFLLSLSLLNCSNKTHKSQKVKKQNTYERFFREKRIFSRNQFSHIESVFEKEILGTPEEIVQARKAIEKRMEGYYKVYYLVPQQIQRYEYIEKGRLTAYANYEYAVTNAKTADRLLSIKYYNEKLNYVAKDEITYDDFGRAIKTRRYVMPRKRLHNAF